MKYHLPKTNTSPKGFTLIELLVVIAVIAIVSVVAIALFSNVQGDARDGKRKAELESIANVLEVNKTSAGYQPILAARFGGSIFPGGTATALDPQLYPYCVTGTAAGVAATLLPADFTLAPSCTNVNFTVISGTQPVAGSTVYKLCTRLEVRGVPAVFCRTNVQ